MKYKSSDFGSCTFNPLTEEVLLTAYPRLEEIIPVEWYEDKYLDNLIRYVIIVYDPGSPLIYNERDLNYRKGQASELACIPQEDETLLSQVYDCSYSFLSDLILRYLMRFAKSKEWAAICAFESSFWESIRELLVPIEGKDSKQKLESVQKKSAIKNEIDADIKRIDQYYKAFLGHDEELLARTKKRITPEMIANSR